MRKTYYILLILTYFSCSTPKPEGLILKMQFQPEKTYTLSTIRGTETVITYSGEAIAMRKLKSMRVSNPTVSKVKTKTETELETGKIQTDQSFPLTLSYLKTMSLDGKNEIPVGTKVEGKISGENLPVFDVVTSGILDINQKNQLLQAVRNNFGQFDFPQQLMKIGDQFSTDRPVSMPMEGSVIDIVVTTSYRLTSIKNQLAQFELSQTYHMTPRILDNSFKGNGSGKGWLNFDTEKKLITDYSLRTELEMNKKLDYYEFDLKTINEFSQQIQLVKN